MSVPDSSPLAPASFFVLFALSEGDKHGYAIMQDVRSLSENQFDMGPATLYTNLQRLLDCSWVKDVPGPKGSDPRRRYYRITSEGSSALAAELSRMDAILRKSRAMKLRLAGS